MGKVGSSTVLRTLEDALTADRPVLHTHFLQRDTLQRIRARDGASRGRLRVGATWALGAAVSRRLRAANPAPALDVVSLVRDPIARAVSALFQSPSLASDRSLVLADGRLDAKRAIAWLAETLERAGEIDYPERWLDGELRDGLGIDVFATPFDRERGHQILSTGSTRLMLLRMEDLDRRLGPALQAFLDLDAAPTVQSANVRLASGARRDYRDVLDGFRLPAALVRRIYAESRVARHFYGAREIDAFTRRWSEPS